MTDWLFVNSTVQQSSITSTMTLSTQQQCTATMDSHQSDPDHSYITASTLLKIL